MFDLSLSPYLIKSLVSDEYRLLFQIIYHLTVLYMKLAN
jgi:hypothetical protein